MLKPGDVVTTIFAYSDLTGAKIRPALVISTESYNQETHLAVLAMIFSKQIRNRHEANILGWRDAGLRFPSKVCIGRLKRSILIWLNLLAIYRKMTLGYSEKSMR